MSSRNRAYFNEKGTLAQKSRVEEHMSRLLDEARRLIARSPEIVDAFV